MGLDMFLTKKFYVLRGDRDKVKITGVKGVNSKKVMHFEEEVGYWRKANAIHRWFVENVQDGEDDCKDYYVSEDQIKELLKNVEIVLEASKLVKGKVHAGTTWENGKQIESYQNGKVIRNPSIAMKLLPTAGGFFFGSTEYNEYYIKDLEETKKILKKALKSKGTGEFYYSSSW